jgi:hypothetical protein
VKSFIAKYKGQGFEVLVDDDDFPQVSKHNWRIKPHKQDHQRNLFYVRANIAGRTVYLHRYLMNPAKGQVVDFIDHNPLNCQRSNLRVTDRSHDRANSRKHIPKTCEAKGVCYDPKRNLYKSQIGVHGKVKTIGRYPSVQQASHAYDQKSEHTFGQFALTNRQVMQGSKVDASTLGP